jgi:hypothetical protein
MKIMLKYIIYLKLQTVLEERAASIFRVRPHFPEDSDLHRHCRENLDSRVICKLLVAIANSRKCYYAENAKVVVALSQDVVCSSLRDCYSLYETVQTGQFVLCHVDVLRLSIM